MQTTLDSFHRGQAAQTHTKRAREQDDRSFRLRSEGADDGLHPVRDETEDLQLDAARDRSPAVRDQ